MQRNEELAAPLVTGKLIISTSTPSFSNATVHIRLEDVSWADAAAVVITETTLTDVHHAPANGDNTVLSFALRAEPGAAAIDPHHQYAVRVWVDRNSDGQPAAGDLFSDQSYRVLTGGFGSSVTITVTSRN